MFAAHATEIGDKVQEIFDSRKPATLIGAQAKTLAPEDMQDWYRIATGAPTVETIKQQEGYFPLGNELDEPQFSVASRLLERYTLAFHSSDYHNQQIDLLNELVAHKAKGLPLKKREYIPESAIRENEVIHKMKRMLSDDPRSLHD